MISLLFLKIYVVCMRISNSDLEANDLSSSIVRFRVNDNLPNFTVHGKTIPPSGIIDLRILKSECAYMQHI